MSRKWQTKKEMLQFSSNNVITGPWMLFHGFLAGGHWRPTSGSPRTWWRLAEVTTFQLPCICVSVFYVHRCVYVGVCVVRCSMRTCWLSCRLPVSSCRSCWVHRRATLTYIISHHLTRRCTGGMWRLCLTDCDEWLMTMDRWCLTDDDRQLCLTGDST